LETSLAIAFVIGFGFSVLVVLALAGWLVPRDPAQD